MKQTPFTLTLLAWAAHLFFAGNAPAATQNDLAGPARSGEFGRTVTVLPNGNIVVTDPYCDAPGLIGDVGDVGAVYLYNSAGTLLSTLKGIAPNDKVGIGGVTVLTNGNYVVRSPLWNGAAPAAGAATWCSGATGCDGVVSASNSLVGTSLDDQIGTSVSALRNGHYVTRSAQWDNGATLNAGAVTWGNGATGRSGAVSGANSLVGTTDNDEVGGGGLRVLPNGNYVVNSPKWNSDTISEAGASTWCNGSAGCVGAVTTANSLYGTTANDRVGAGGGTVLTNSNYVVRSQFWSNGAALAAGAATWVDGGAGRTGAVSPANSLVGSTKDDTLGALVVALANGHYAVGSAAWDNGAVVDAGAVTWCDGTSGRTGAVSPSNSLVGSTSQDQVGSSGVAALTNGNYVVNSPNWNDGAILGVGAATWCNGTTGRTGVVSAANSLVGAIAGDQVGIATTPLAEGHYVVQSTEWNNGPLADVGAATWCNGTTGRTGLVSASNSLVGDQFRDRVGAAVAALANGNYVVGSPFWDNGTIADAGAATWCDGTAGSPGAVSAFNSLVGTGESDRVSEHGIAPLADGDYVVNSRRWHSADLGAVTWCSGITGRTGAVSASNSLVGSTLADQVGSGFALPDGNYLIRTTTWDKGGIENAGAITLGRGDTGTVGAIDGSNSVRGAVADGGEFQVTAYNANTGQLVVGRPAENIVTLFASYRGPDFTVTTTADHNDGNCGTGDCTLREAILAANALPDDNTITFAPGVAGIIQLTSALPILSNNLTLQGPGANLLTVRRNSAGVFRIFDISNGESNGPTVSITGLTISNGESPGGGGGILNDHGTVLVRDCVLSGNRSSLVAYPYGGGIYNWGGRLTIEQSTLIGNVSKDGGGVASTSTSGETALLVIRNSTLSGNMAEGGSGGGVYSEANGSGSTSDLSLTNSTLSGNSATAAGFFGGSGGAIYNFGSTSGVAQASIQDCTLSGNNAPNAGGIYNNSFSATVLVTLRNTILQTGAIGENFINSSGTISSLGNNLCNDAAGGPGGSGPGGYLNATGDMRQTDPLLGPLQNNSGHTLTHALLNGSPAINAGSNATVNQFDQRDYPRVGTNDIGAFEFGSALPAPVPVSAVSRKLHGGTPFDIDLPFVGEVGVECRSGSANSDYQVVVSFANAVTYTGASVSFGAGSVLSSTGSGTNSITVNLTGMTSGQTSTITLGGVSDGVDTGDVSLLMAVLVGDTNDNGIVNSGDTLQTRNRSGQAADSTNFRSDVNADGIVNSGDTIAVRSRSGTALPP